MIFQGVTSTPKTEAVTISIIFAIIKRKKLTREYYLIEFKKDGKLVNLMTPEAYEEPQDYETLIDDIFAD